MPRTVHSADVGPIDLVKGQPFPPRRVDRRRSIDRAADGIDAGQDAARHLAGAELRHDDGVDDVCGDVVRERQAVAHFDAHLAIVRRHDQHSTARCAAADLPAIAEVPAPALDGVALQVWQRHHHQLDVRQRLQSGGLRHQRLLLVRADDVGGVHHRAGTRRQLRIGQADIRTDQQARQENGNRAPVPRYHLTPNDLPPNTIQSPSARSAAAAEPAGTAPAAEAAARA